MNCQPYAPMYATYTLLPGPSIIYDYIVHWTHLGISQRYELRHTWTSVFVGMQLLVKGRLESLSMMGLLALFEVAIPSELLYQPGSAHSAPTELTSSDALCSPLCRPCEWRLQAQLQWPCFCKHYSSQYIFPSIAQSMSTYGYLHILYEQHSSSGQPDVPVSICCLFHMQTPSAAAHVQ